MKSTRRGRCANCPTRINPGEEIEWTGIGWAHADCPVIRRQAAPPPPEATGPLPAVVVCIRCGMPAHTADKCAKVTADPGPWIQRIRENLHISPPGEDEECIQSPFRDRYRMPLVTLSQSRAEARRQVEELRRERGEVS